MKLKRTENTDQDFTRLTSELDAELSEKYGSQQLEYDDHNIIDSIDTVIVGCIDDEPVACGCFKVIDSQTVEIKRMYVKPAQRGKGRSVAVLNALENWSSELGFAKIRLETAKGQLEARGLYRKFGYEVIENYGPYQEMHNSVCMQKILC